MAVAVRRNSEWNLTQNGVYTVRVILGGAYTEAMEVT
jgi:hypothetical protein